ncbi:MAG: M23 family metallopeptidase [Cyclobacteriaceae bacterium]
MKGQRTKKETIGEWLYARHQLILRNEENFEEKTTFTYTHAKAIAIAFGIFVFIFTLTIVLDRHYFIYWGGELNQQKEYNRQLGYLSYKIDSLEHSAESKNYYMKSIQLVLDGQDPDKLFTNDTLKESKIGKSDYSPVALSADKKIREDFEDEEIGESYPETDEGFTEDLLLSPVNGYAVSSKYKPTKGHFGVDILTKENQVVSTVADGTILFSEWTIEGGNTIMIQHENDLVSVYKHNAVLLKKVGNFVKSGDAVAIVGNSGEETTGHHLHFELWYNGKPYNPESILSL